MTARFDTLVDLDINPVAPGCFVVPSAECGRCGDELLSHITSDPDDDPTLGDAGCSNDAMDSFWQRRPIAQFVVTDEDVCADRTQCDVCGADVCAEHTEDVVKCAAAGYHHPGCQHGCEDCFHDAREAALEAIAEARAEDTRAGWDR